MTLPGFITRLHGVILTNAPLAAGQDGLYECIRRGEYNAKKVVTAWGTGGAWTDSNRKAVIDMPGKTIVRTLSGDGQYPGQGYAGNSDAAGIYPNPDAIEAEIAPWYKLLDTIYIEIGNEPNTAQWWDLYKVPQSKPDAENFIWKWKYHFELSLARVRDRFPKAKVISPGLTENFERWYEICQPAFAKANFVGFHQYSDRNFYGVDSWTDKIMQTMAQYFPNKDWFCTEYGLSGTGIHAPTGLPFKRIKGRLYAELAHFGAGERPWPSNVKGGVYYHLNLQNQANDPYAIFSDLGDYAYRGRKNNGSVALKANNGKFVCADGTVDPRLIANRTEIQAWETFDMVSQGGDLYALKAHNGKFVCADANLNGALIANRDQVQAWEKFQVVPHPQDINRFALRAHNGKFVCADENLNGTLIANRDLMQAWETFTVVHRFTHSP